MWQITKTKIKEFAIPIIVIVAVGIGAIGGKFYFDTYVKPTPSEPIVKTKIPQVETTKEAVSELNFKGILTEKTILDRIAVSQATFLQSNGIYFQGYEDWDKKVEYQGKSMSELVDISDMEAGNPQIKIHQYENSRDEVGYQVFLTYPDGTRKSFGYGHEAVNRTWERITTPNTATTTP